MAVPSVFISAVIRGLALWFHYLVVEYHIHIFSVADFSSDRCEGADIVDGRFAITQRCRYRYLNPSLTV